MFEKTLKHANKTNESPLSANTSHTLIPLVPNNVYFSSAWQERRPEGHWTSCLKYEQSHTLSTELQEIYFLQYLFGHNLDWRFRWGELKGFKVTDDHQITSYVKWSTGRCKGGGGMVSEESVTQQQLVLVYGNEPLTSSPLQVFGWLQPHKQPAASCHPCPEASTCSIPRKHTLFWFVLPVIILCLSKPTKNVSWIEKSILKQKGSKDTAEIFKEYRGKWSSSAPFAHKGY